MSDSHRWMSRCFELAEVARANGEPAVGCVVVRGEELIAEASESMRATLDPGGHAEMLALREACRLSGTLDLSDCSLYTNVEPCVMCSYAIRECGLSQVCFGEPYPEMGGVNSAFPILMSSSPAYRYPPPVVIFLDIGR